MQQVLIYTEKNSPRLQYIFEFLLSEILGLSYKIIHSKEEFSNYTGVKFSYANQPVTDEIFLAAIPLLFETVIKPQPIDFCDYKEIKGFFPVFHDKSVMPFDLFASAFFMISRYEEYLPGKKDKYDRYRGSQSMNHKAGFLEKPMVDLYALEFKKILQQKFPELKFKERKFSYTATFDIDMAYSYLHKGFKRNFGGFLRSFILSEYKEMRARFGVLMRGMRDPFDTYEYIFEVCKKHNIPTYFFFLLGDESRFDKNVEHTNEGFRSLIRSIDQKTKTGIHLSFKSHISSKKSQEEIKRLTEITGKPTISNRFHYLRFQTPNSFKRLEELGIKEDYSMGYAGRVGFRAGTCTPYYFFNVKSNEQTNLKIVPFAFMDTTFTHYYRIENERSIAKILELIAAVKKVEGSLVGLWHNSSFTEQLQWRGWRKIFETVAEEASRLTQ
jgi:hypothetical protein